METKIRINPEDVTILIRFVRNFLTFDEDKLIALRNPRIYEFSIFPTSLLVPVYRYSPTPLGKKLGIELKYEDKINIENLSYFSVVKLPEKSDIKIDLSLEPTDNDGKAIIWGVRVNLNDPSYRFKALVDGSLDNGGFSRDLRTIKWAKGRSYSKHSKSFVSKVTGSILRIEEYLFILSNLLYTIYSEEYRKDSKEAELLAPVTEILKDYGNTFEDVLLSIKVAVMFTL